MAFVPCESIIKFESTTPKKASFQSHSPAGYSRNKFQSTSVVSRFLLGITNKSCGGVIKAACQKKGATKSQSQKE
jgi:hypothetical protein